MKVTVCCCRKGSATELCDMTKPPNRAGAHTCISRLAAPILGALLLISAPLPLESSETGIPGGLAYVWWKFERPEFEDFQIDITIYNDLAATPGLYFQMYQGQIGDIGFYFGLQTDVYEPDAGGRGKGLIFSRWKTRDVSETRPAPDGWVQSAGYEGDFVGIRKKYAWTNHRYRLRLTAVDEDDKGLWYGLFILDYDIRTEDYAGAIRFPKARGQRPRIRDGGGTWMEIYSDANQRSDVPSWHVSIDGCFADNRKVRAKEAVADYSKVPDTDIYLVKETGSIHMLIGKGVSREHPKGKLF